MELGQHLVDELVRKRLPEDLPERGFLPLQLCFRRQGYMAAPGQPRRSFLHNFVVAGFLKLLLPGF